CIAQKPLLLVRLREVRDDPGLPPAIDAAGLRPFLVHWEVDYLRTRLLLHLRLAIRRKTPRGADYPSILKRTLELFEGFRCVSVFFQEGERSLVQSLVYLLQLSRHLSSLAGTAHL